MAKSNVWMSVSDLMTGLMVIFLFIAVAYMIQVKENQNVLTDYVETKTKLHDKLVSEFKEESKTWDMSIGKDLSMRFNNPTVLFAQGSAAITPQFKVILDEFIPKYLDILLNDSLRSHIQEIRIEGHTDNVPYPQLHPQPFVANVILSQQRALSVLMYIQPMTLIAFATASTTTISTSDNSISIAVRTKMFSTSTTR
jgi:outer membrane protein OmpA-like peptidoglycan-associated protein